MAKHPTPKRRHPKASGRKRYSMYQFRIRRKLKNRVSLVTCANCKKERLTHHACLACGFYRGRKVLDLSSKIKDKIKKVSA